MVSYGLKEASDQTSPKVAAYLALPHSDKVEISRSEGEGGSVSSENCRSTPRSWLNRPFVFAVDAVQERASFAPTATFVALDLPFPPPVEVAKFWGVCRVVPVFVGTGRSSLRTWPT